MAEKKWKVIYGEYIGLEKRALNLINATVFDFYNDYLPFYSADEVSEDLLKSNNLIIVGRYENNKLIRECIDSGELVAPDCAQGYSIEVKDSKWSKEHQTVFICGADECGVMYGAVDFANKYCGYIIYKSGKGSMEYAAYFDAPFKEKLPEWKAKSSPSVETRAIWTWGHCIYDYRSFFENMVMLKLNEIVIWNDYAPINASEVVDYAHALGIKVVWGFAWGWGTDCNVSMGLDEESLRKLKNEIVERYEREYASSGADGIYFQSCTELNQEYIGEKLIAEVVVDFVNDTASELFERHPGLHVQFGLHSNSVKHRLEYIAKVDPRVMIVWENCGVFPFNSKVDHGYECDFEPVEETVDFVERISTLRSNDELFGVVLKGVCTLDWSNFTHQEKNIILGEKSKSFIKKRSEGKHHILRFRQTPWLRYPDHVAKVIRALVKRRNTNTVEIVVEDAIFENEIPISVAVYAETLWNCNRDGDDIVSDASKFPCVKFANI